MRRAALLLALTGCPGPFWGRICLGGTTDPSEACVVADGVMIAAAGGVVGAHALNHDTWDNIKDGPPLPSGWGPKKLAAPPIGDLGIGASRVSQPDAGPVDGGSP